MPVLFAICISNGSSSVNWTFLCLNNDISKNFLQLNPDIKDQQSYLLGFRICVCVGTCPSPSPCLFLFRSWNIYQIWTKKGLKSKNIRIRQSLSWELIWWGLLSCELLLTRKKGKGSMWESTGCYISLVLLGRGWGRGGGILEWRRENRVKGGGRAPPPLARWTE